MEAVQVNSPLNPMQIHFLQSLRFVHTDEMYQELRQLISDYHFRKMNEETDKWWKKNDMTQEKLEGMFLNSHYRTPYK
jgi:hypothetical protein